MTNAPYPPLPTGPSQPGPLTAAQHEEVAAANDRAAKIRRASRLAAFNGWTLAILAALSLPFSWSSPSGLFITVGMGVVAWNELRGRKGLLRFHAPTATMLGWNQIALLTMVIVYCGWMLVLTFNGSLDAELAKQLKEYRDVAGALNELGNLRQIAKLISVAVYASILVVSLIFQGLNAFYYFTRRGLIEAYVRETPGWVVELQRTLTPG